jgi:hypothetical protein
VGPKRAGNPAVKSGYGTAAKNAEIDRLHVSLEVVMVVQFLTMYSPTLRAFAAMVRLGFIPADVGMKLASTTNKFGTPKKRHAGSNTALAGSGPKRHVPMAWENVFTGILM